MKRFAVYTLLQGKRAARLLPRFLAVLLLLAAGAYLAALGLAARRAADDARQKALVGVVGNENNPYVRIGLDALMSFDAARDELQFVFLDEETAKAELRAGRLSAFLYLPDDFVDSIYAGETNPIRFVTPEGAAGLDTLLSAELAAAVARLMTETQNAQYGAQRYARDFVPEADPYEVDNALVDRYFAMVLRRDRLFSVKLIGLGDALSFGGYYFCGILTAFLLLLGTGAGPFFSRRSGALSALLRARGFGLLRQVLGEFLPFALLLLAGALAAAALALPLLRQSAADIPELRDLAFPALAGALAQAVLCVAATQFLLYELVPSPLGGTVLQFLAAAAQGYVCGCFYPAAFLPDAVQRLGRVLPGGRALQCLGSALRGAGGAAWAALAWVPAARLLAAALRFARSRRGGAA